MIMQNGKCVGGANKFLCPCQQTDNGFPTSGICQADFKCHANSTGGKSPDQGLSQLGQMLGQLLSKLGQSSGSGSGSGSSPTTTGCQSSYYYTSNASLIGVDPCALYQPASTCTDPTASNYGASATCTYANGTGTTTGTGTCSLVDEIEGNCGGSNPGGSSTTTPSSTPTLSANPESGSTPLVVTFSTTGNSSLSYTVDPGDGSGPQALSSAACTNSISSSCVYSLTYTYTSAGTYTASLSDSNGDQLGNATISVTNPGGSTNGSSDSGSLTSVFDSVGGLFQNGATSTPGGSGGQSFSNFPGVLGNILLDQNGATIFASTINSANNSQTSSFYGSDTLSQPQGVIASMCQGRPWANNFLANIIPPTFFDSLCQWGGFQVGQTQQTATQPQVSLTQQTTTPATTNTAPAVATTTTSSVPAQAIIWAVPASVPLGARTSVFWNSQGVTSCTESSPDGSFTETSLSGAAATVPITSATTFTISCLDPSGNPITDYVTVSLSN